jgi:hypothetical protein
MFQGMQWGIGKESEDGLRESDRLVAHSLNGLYRDCRVIVSQIMGKIFS